MKPVYRRMLQGLKSDSTRGPWFVYLVECSDGTLYTGIAKDVSRRVQQHNDGRGARYTRTRRPVKLLYYEVCESRSLALIRECAVKSLPRERKLSLAR